MDQFLITLKQIGSNSMAHKVAMVLISVLAFYMASSILTRLIRDISLRRGPNDIRALYVTRLMNMGLTFCCFVVVCLIFGLGYSEVSVFLSSIFAVVGIALFAQWSILSNVTASMLIFFGFPYKVGDRIKILDKDDDMRGTIVEISSFHVILRRDDGNLITYPNTLILQKAVLKIESPETEPPETASSLNAASTVKVGAYIPARAPLSSASKPIGGNPPADQ